MADETYEVTERLCLTEDDRVVVEGDPDARWLYAIPGHRIPLADALKYGLVAGDGFVAEDDETTVSLTEEGESVVAEGAPAVPVVDEPEAKRSRRK